MSDDRPDTAQMRDAAQVFYASQGEHCANLLSAAADWIDAQPKAGTELQMSNLGVVAPGSIVRISLPGDYALDAYRAMVERLRAEIIQHAGHDDFTVAVTCGAAELDLSAPVPPGEQKP